MIIILLLKMVYISIFVVFIVKMGLTLGVEYAPLVTIPDGTIMGSVNQTIRKNMTYFAYRGIPFAKKPVGDLRFAAPVKNDPWNGTLNATQDKDICTQAPLGSLIISGSEDCLYINVYTTNINGSLPVMVWIYGGTFIAGDSTYDKFNPNLIIEGGVIYISFNYRVGSFGFLSTEDSAAYGNWGLKDQVLALKWVKDNCQYFGGDPNKITIFGESAGSVSLSYLLASNLTTGLFHRAILQSGTSLCAWGLTLNARSLAFHIGKNLGILTTNSATLINELRKIDYRILKSAESLEYYVAAITGNILAGLPIGVVEEKNHPNAVFSGKSHQMLKEGHFHKIPIIVGFNSNEALAFQPFIDLVRGFLIGYDLANQRFAPNGLTPSSVDKLKAGTEIKLKYLGPSIVVSSSKNLTYFVSNDQFIRPIREFVNLISDYIEVFYYLLSYEGSNDVIEGVGHAEDLDYIFPQNFNGSSEDMLTSDRIVTLWTNFAKTGNPTLSANNSILGNITWEPNTPSDNTNVTVKYLDINSTLSMKTNPYQADWEYYQYIYRKYGDPPFTTF